MEEGYRLVNCIMAWKFSEEEENVEIFEGFDRSVTPN